MVERDTNLLLSRVALEAALARNGRNLCNLDSYHAEGRLVDALFNGKTNGVPEARLRRLRSLRTRISNAQAIRWAIEVGIFGPLHHDPAHKLDIGVLEQANKRGDTTTMIEEVLSTEVFDTKGELGGRYVPLGVALSAR